MKNYRQCLKQQMRNCTFVCICLAHDPRVSGAGIEVEAVVVFLPHWLFIADTGAICGAGAGGTWVLGMIMGYSVAGGVQKMYPPGTRVDQGWCSVSETCRKSLFTE